MAGWAAHHQLRIPAVTILQPIQTLLEGSRASLKSPQAQDRALLICILSWRVRRNHTNLQPCMPGTAFHGAQESLMPSAKCSWEQDSRLGHSLPSAQLSLAASSGTSERLFYPSVMPGSCGGISWSSKLPPARFTCSKQF